MRIDRTKNTARNVAWGLFERLLQTILPFVTRTLILKLIGERYLGLNGLFTSIISVLNLADLGFGAAITFSMYKPIADNDDDALCAVLNLYKKIYRIIGTVVLVGGLAVMPFLPYLTKGDAPEDINIYVLFAIYLANTVISYWLFAYKRSLLHAYQRDDVVTKIAMALLVGQYGLQILALAAFNNYYAYVIVLPLITLSSNIITNIVTNKMFPGIVCRGKVSDDTNKKIKKQVSGAFVGKICATTRNSLDSVFISSFLGLTKVAIYGNYYYILSAVHSVMNVVTNSMVGGVGNSTAKDSLDKNYGDFKRFTFLYSWIGGWCACCMLCLYQPFMRLWTGEALMLPFGTMVLFCVYLYVMSCSDIKNVYYSARGLWWEGRWRAIFEVALNLVLNIVGAMFFGIIGILAATIITMVLVNFLYGSHILFKNYFTNANIVLYWLRHLGYLAVTAVVSVLTYLLCSLLPEEGVGFLVIRFAICAVVPNILFFLAYFKTAPFREVKPFIGRIFARLFKRKAIKGDN